MIFVLWVLIPVIGQRLHEMTLNPPTKIGGLLPIVSYFFLLVQYLFLLNKYCAMRQQLLYLSVCKEISHNA